MRLFVSIDLPETLTESVRAVQAEFEGASGLTFTDPSQVHVTLRFLGDVDEDELPEVTRAVAEAVAAADVEPFTATFGGLGVFPSLDYISVVWLGVTDGGEQMTRLFQRIESRVVDLGFEPERHAFTPHVTLARMKHAGGKEHVQETVETLDPEVGSMPVEEVRLTESQLGREGPVYATVERFPL